MCPCYEERDADAKQKSVAGSDAIGVVVVDAARCAEREGHVCLARVVLRAALFNTGVAESLASNPVAPSDARDSGIREGVEVRKPGEAWRFDDGEVGKETDEDGGKLGLGTDDVLGEEQVSQLRQCRCECIRHFASHSVRVVLTDVNIVHAKLDEIWWEESEMLQIKFAPRKVEDFKLPR